MHDVTSTDFTNCFTPSCGNSKTMPVPLGDASILSPTKHVSLRIFLRHTVKYDILGLSQVLKCSVSPISLEIVVCMYIACT